VDQIQDIVPDRLARPPSHAAIVEPKPRLVPAHFNCGSFFRVAVSQTQRGLLPRRTLSSTASPTNHENMFLKKLLDIFDSDTLQLFEFE
jgi:hypothetical protein